MAVLLTILIVILKIILYLILAIIGIIVLLLMIPFTYSGELAYEEGIRSIFYFGWPGKLFRIKGVYGEDKLDMGIYLGNKLIKKIDIDNTEKKIKDEEEKIEEEVEETLEEEKGKLKEFLNKELINEALQYLKKLGRIIRPKYLHLKGTYGFDDPSTTGMVSGAVAIFKGWFPKARIYLNPCFHEEIFEIDFKADGRATIGRLTFVTLRTLLKKPIRQIIFKKNKK